MLRGLPVRAGSPAIAFDLRSSLLGPSPSESRVPRGASRSSRCRRGQCLPQHRRQSFASGRAIAQLQSLLLGADDEHRSGQPRRQVMESSGALGLVEDVRPAHIEAQLHPRIGRVHALAARARRMRESFDELARRNRQPVGDSRAGRHMQIIHGSSQSPRYRAAALFQRTSSTSSADSVSTTSRRSASSNGRLARVEGRSVPTMSA